MTTVSNLTERALQRARNHASKNIFLNLTEDRARSEAVSVWRSAKGDQFRGIFKGEPIAVKANIDLVGELTSAGSKAVAAIAEPARADAKIVELLKQAGATILGQTNMSEFAFSGLGLNPGYGTAANPLSGDDLLAPGGSSSGSASAVSHGIVSLAIGTDTSGSVRVPAAWQGLVGYRPSFGRYPMEGIFPLAPSLDVAGPIAQSVSQCIRFDTAVTGMVHQEPAGPDRFSFVTPDDAFFQDVDPWIWEQFESALERLRRCGACVERQNISTLYDTQNLFSAHGTMVVLEAKTVIDPYLDQTEHAIDSNVVRRLEQGRSITENSRLKVYNARRPLMERLRVELDGQLLLMPTTPTSAPLVSTIKNDPEAFAIENAKALRHTMLGSYLDMASITIPVVSDDEGRSSGLLISGTSGSDETLLSAALALEMAITPP